MAALDQIDRGSQNQSTGAKQSAASISQIEHGAVGTQQRAKDSLERGEIVSKQIAESSTGVEQLINGVLQSLEATNRTRDQVNGL